MSPGQLRLGAGAHGRKGHERFEVGSTLEWMRGQVPGSGLVSSGYVCGVEHAFTPLKTDSSAAWTTTLTIERGDGWLKRDYQSGRPCGWKGAGPDEPWRLICPARTSWLEPATVLWKAPKMPKGFPSDLAAVGRRKLRMLDAAVRLDDLKVPPGNRLEALSGDRKGQHSIRVNDPWRVCFIWRDGGAHEVEITDYH
jgi:proteic killer suppression protein